MYLGKGCFRQLCTSNSSAHQQLCASESSARQTAVCIRQRCASHSCAHSNTAVHNRQTAVHIRQLCTSTQLCTRHQSVRIRQRAAHITTQLRTRHQGAPCGTVLAQGWPPAQALHISPCLACVCMLDCVVTTLCWAAFECEVRCSSGGAHQGSGCSVGDA